MTTSPVTAPRLSADLELTWRAGMGNRTAQGELFRSLKASVHATLYRMLGSNQHMEDLMQDVFVRIYAALPTYRGEAPLPVWAARISGRVGIEHLQRAGTRQKQRSARPMLRLVGSVEEHAQHREGIQRLYVALDRLKPQYRVAFVLFALDGRSCEEVAQIMGVSLVVARNHVARARSKLWASARKDPVLAGYLAETH